MSSYVLICSVVQFPIVHHLNLGKSGSDASKCHAIQQESLSKSKVLLYDYTWLRV